MRSLAYIVTLSYFLFSLVISIVLTKWFTGDNYGKVLEGALPGILIIALFSWIIPFRKNIRQTEVLLVMLFFKNPPD